MTYSVCSYDNVTRSLSHFRCLTTIGTAAPANFRSKTEKLCLAKEDGKAEIRQICLHLHYDRIGHRIHSLPFPSFAFITRCPISFLRFPPVSSALFFFMAGLFGPPQTFLRSPFSSGCPNSVRSKGLLLFSSPSVARQKVRPRYTFLFAVSGFQGATRDDEETDGAAQIECVTSSFNSWKENGGEDNFC